MQQYLIAQSDSIAHALSELNALSNATMTLIAVDDNHRPVGTLTDGDIRRALLAGHTLDSPVSAAMNREFKYVCKSDARLLSFQSLRDRGIRLLPVTDFDNRLIDCIDLTQRLGALNIPALIMAGGRGERLRPATLTTPKPLLSLAGKPIIDYTIDLLNRYGITDITVSTRYLAEQIISHFENTGIKCIIEDEPLGTIGAISLLDNSEVDTVIVMNSDLYTDIQLDEMLRHHIESDAVITVAAIPYTVSVPYAILTTDESGVTGLTEKPTYSFYANAGIYLLNTKALSFVKYNERLDATELIEGAIARNLRVSYYPISGTWIDIGTPADFKHADELIRHS